MKVVAYSSAPVRLPYMHVGYLSAGSNLISDRVTLHAMFARVLAGGLLLALMASRLLDLSFRRVIIGTAAVVGSLVALGSIVAAAF